MKALIFFLFLIPITSFADSEICVVSLTPQIQGDAHQLRPLDYAIREINGLMYHIMEVEPFHVEWEIGVSDASSYSPHKNLLTFPESIGLMRTSTQTWIYARHLGEAVFAHTQIFSSSEAEAQLHKGNIVVHDELNKLGILRKTKSVNELQFATDNQALLKLKKSIDNKLGTLSQPHNQEFYKAASRLFSDIVALLVVGHADTWAQACLEFNNQDVTTCSRLDFRTPFRGMSWTDEHLDFDSIRHFLWAKYIRNLKTPEEKSVFLSGFIGAVKAEADHLRAIAPGDYEGFTKSFERRLEILEPTMRELWTLADQNKVQVDLKP